MEERKKRIIKRVETFRFTWSDDVRSLRREFGGRRERELSGSERNGDFYGWLARNFYPFGGKSGQRVGRG